MIPGVQEESYVGRTRGLRSMSMALTMFHWGLLGSALASLLIVRYAALHLRITGDRPTRGPQKFHTRPVPRIGGIAVAVGLLVGGVASLLRGLPGTAFYWLMLLALLPAFAGGLVEDMTRKVGPAPRLALTVVSGAIAFTWLGARLYRSDIEWLDTALALGPISLLASLFAVAGVAHAMNIIDGYNGLSGGVGTMTLIAIATVAFAVGDVDIARLAMAAAGAYFGFLLFNFPGGRIFQGDSGAYLLGTLIAILAAQLVARNADISPWFPFVLVVYPVWETLFSVIRRAATSQPISAPDAHHLHSLIYQVAMPQLLPRRDERSLLLRNSLTSVPLWLMQLTLCALAVRWHNSTGSLMAVCYGFVGVYCLVYVLVAMLDRRRVARDVPAGNQDLKSS